jgi:hypothetical protein
MRAILLGAAILAGVSAWGQATPPGSAYPAKGSNLTFTNPMGGSYSADEFAVQLQNLRTSIEQTLPLLTAFTQTYSNTAPGTNMPPGGKKSVTGEASGYLSGLLQKGATNAALGSAGTNAITKLEGLLGTNAPGSTGTNADTMQDLIELQNHLLPSLAILQRLNVGGGSGTNHMGGGLGGTTAPGGVAPTGR